MMLRNHAVLTIGKFVAEMFYLQIFWKLCAAFKSCSESWIELTRVIKLKLRV
jgi:hypothetical protein